MRHIVSIAIFSLLILSSCQDDQASINLDADLEPYFLSFQVEGIERGLDINLEKENISAHLSLIDKQNTQGLCNHYSDGSKEIVIDTEYWAALNEIEKEYLVYHELGHCYLGRSHDDNKDATGNCISIMQSGEGLCRNNYNLRNRDAYLDELFDF